VKGLDGVESLITRREVVVGIMPKRRKDSAICFVSTPTMTMIERLKDRMGRKETNVVVWRKGEHDLGMYVSTLKPIFQEVIYCSVCCC